MLRLMIFAIPILLFGCDQFKKTAADGPIPLKIEKVVRCNKFRTCVVIFQNGTNGLMTSPKEGEYGCKSMSNRAYNRCDPPEEEKESKD